MKKDIKDEASKIQKIIRGFFGVLGGGTAIATFIMGVYCIINFPLPLIGGLIIVMAPLEILLTKKAVDSVQVIPPVEEYEEIKSKLTVIKCDNPKGEERVQGVEFTEIKPMVHLEIVDSNKKGYGKVKNKK